MRQKGSNRLFEYWNTLRGTRPAPERGEIEPGDIREMLGDTFILEVAAQMRTIAFRLAGTRLCAAYGRELKGLGFLALWDEEANFAIAKTVRRVYRDYQPMLVSYTAATAEGHFVEFEMVLLPLMPVADGNARILGLASPRKVPYWFGAEPLVVNHLRHLRTIETTVAAPPLAPAEVREAGAPSAEDRRRRVAHLTVLDGGRGKA
ncbi:MAG: PAS domain-containing protein [Alphaproteobacteria bacterium]|nr:MAG: PAS domain-containing protein [Alphaproteobacteria bacterium]